VVGVKQSPKSPFPVLKIADRIEERLFLEVWPQGGCEVELRIRQLPEQKIGDPVLAARSNHQFWIWDSFGGKVVTDAFRSDFLR
jgi:hypothetical protein